MKNKDKGLLALLGIGASAYAYWKYKQLTPEEKAKIKDKLDKVGDKFQETVDEVEITISEKYEQLKTAAKNKLKDIAE